MSDDDNITSTNIDVKTLPQLPPSPPPETENKNDPIILTKLTIRSPSYVAFLNASLLASELDEKVQIGSYNSPSCMPNDEHSDLDATSPKLKFGNIIEFISHTPKTQNDSPISNRTSPTLEQNVNISKNSPTE